MLEADSPGGKPVFVSALEWLEVVDISSTPSIGVSPIASRESVVARFVRLQAHLSLGFKQPSHSCSSPGPDPATAAAGQSCLLVELLRVVVATVAPCTAACPSASAASNSIMPAAMAQKLTTLGRRMEAAAYQGSRVMII